MAKTYLLADNHMQVISSCFVKLSKTHLLLGLAVVRLQLQDPLETAAGCHSISKRQVAFTLPQMALWVTLKSSHPEVIQIYFF